MVYDLIYDLPTSVEFGGREWEINTDFRDVLNILTAFEDEELTNQEKAYVCLHNLYVDFNEIPPQYAQEAYDAAIAFIDHGNQEDKNKPSKKTMDWTQDAPLIFPAVNHVAGFEVRSADYIHWWTFMGYFMEIKDSTYSTVLSLRQKKAKGKKLEKYEQEYWKNNRAICEIKKRETAEERAYKDEMRKLFGAKG